MCAVRARSVTVTFLRGFNVCVVTKKQVGVVHGGICGENRAGGGRGDKRSQICSKIRYAIESYNRYVVAPNDVGVVLLRCSCFYEYFDYHRLHVSGKPVWKNGRL